MKKLFLILLMCLSITAFSQTDSKDDVKVGLVLSGGGAKGLAHIGVLKTLDSLGVKVDYVAGTSMGSIIGSLYASGYSGKQLDSIFRDIDFDKLISDKIPRSSKTFYEKSNAEKYAITLPFNDFKIQLPSAISKGQNVFNLLSRLTLHVSDIDDFEKLPIPFFCIATNIETGEQVVLDSGSLSQAISASGALPTLFQPITINGETLIDGGVVNNYPIDELRAKGMDIIIGVDVQDGLLNIDELKSAPDILLQINNFRTIKDMRDKSKETDIYIKPDIKGFSVVSFDEGDKIIKNGVIAANQLATELKGIVKRQIKDSEKAPIKLPDSLRIKSIKVYGNQNYTRAYILGKLKMRNSETISHEAFQKGVNSIIATNNFDNFLYRFEPSLDGYNLHIDVVENKNTMFFKLGVHYDDLYKSAAIINVTKKQLLFKNDIASLDFGLGDNLRYNFDYFIDKGFYWSIGVKSRFNSFHKNVNATLLLEDFELTQGTTLNKIDVELRDFTNQVYIQTLFRKNFSLQMGVEYKRLNITSETFSNPGTNEEGATFEKSDFYSVFGELKLDTYDNKYFPKRGFLFDGDFQLFFASSDYNKNFSEFSYSKADIGYAFCLTDKIAVQVGSQGGFKIGEDSNNSLDFALGGYGNDFINNFIPFFGYDYISLTGNSFVKGSVVLDFEPFKKHHIKATVNYANIGDDIFTDGEWITAPDYSGYALGYGIETFLGPIEANFSWSPETNESIWFFNLGFWF